MSVVGESYLVGLIGDGVLPSLTPPMHEAEGDAHGIRYFYRPLDLAVLGRRADEVGAIIAEGRALGFSAFNVTHPCKREVLSALDEVDPVAAAVGAANTVLIVDGKLVGHNTDVTGFESALADGLPGADLGSVVLIGAGGAGGAVAHALLGAGVGRLAIVDVVPASAARLAADTAAAFPAARVSSATPADLATLLADADGLVNASFVGMHSHPGIPVDATLLHPGLWVADIVYRPVVTEFVAAARAAGCRVLDGGQMAVGQAADAFRLITGREPDRARMHAQFLDLVALGR
ncbi:shikimate dehydrogenase [Leifsonia sp. PS1209]|uniref:shikimate dehydrogenase n=1 Tax=Leifsonia sp. PS1209 TaxID=2724914 RepID=UPI001442D864|nr:shikimate dehydrogenase [Leifsonia sp. PS1209]QIZ97736.1 shikimate dehydrogenase [Leifsonia sp. PS1209]